MSNNIKPLVSIQCFVYNHEPFLRQCLDGFVMQKTNFAFEAIVHDDASTDNSAAIIKEYAEKYPDIIKPIFETENQYSKKDGSLRRIMNEAIHPDAKYVAFCEGDDYWTDPYKLQKQVDAFNSNNKLTLVYTSFKTVNEIGEYIYRPFYEHIKEISKSGNLFYDLLSNGNYIMTLTTMYKKDIVTNPIITNYPNSIDYLYILTAAGLGEVHYINEATGCYRKNSNSLMNTKGELIAKLLYEIKYYIIFNYISGNFKKLGPKDDYKVKSEYYLLTLQQKRNIDLRIFRKKPSLFLFFILSFVRFIAYHIKMKFFFQKRRK